MRSIKLALAVAATLALAGCVTLFPKVEPTTLYRFTGTIPAVAETTAPKVGVVKIGGSFSQASAGDQILTVTGDKVAYLSGARWSGPATTLLDEALLRAFASNGGPARLVTRGEPSRLNLALRLDIQTFEAVYDKSPRAAPKIVIVTHLVISRAGDRVAVTDKILTHEVRASANRVSALVKAFDTAASETLAEIVDLTNQAAAS
jgi:cholesterol transport system auxiliary component